MVTVEEAKAELYKAIEKNAGAVRCDGSYPTILPKKQVTALLDAFASELLTALGDSLIESGRKQGWRQPSSFSTVIQRTQEGAGDWQPSSFSTVDDMLKTTC